uniref:Phorbol-ester/DAG-type domain-containing protein n=1 Tax=Nothobranchius furzeri TaxID=105023 RepID=A0A8C6NYS2_NOTFU
MDGGLSPEDNAPSFFCEDCEEPLMFGLIEEYSEDDSSPSRSGKREKSPCIKESQASSPTLAAAARLSAMIQGKDQVFANAMLVDQVDDSDIKYRSPGEEEEVSPASPVGMSCWDSFSSTPFDSGNCSQNRSPLHRGPRGSQGSFSDNHREANPCMSPASPSFPSSPLASSSRLFEGAQRRQMCSSVSPGLRRRGCVLTEANRSLSPSLECDSWEEDILGLSHPYSSLKQRPILRSSSGEERDSFDTSPDFNLPHSDSAYKCNTHVEDPEVRLRSYSCSSPTAKPSRPLLNRDAAITDLEEEQRALNLPEAPREKRIEDEEWDRFMIPSKVESEKYKVSRTFSFLKSRMSSTRSKTKVKGKEVKEGKEKSGAAGGHQFVSVSAPSLCVACEKSGSGKDSLQCSNCFLSVHKNCRESVSACGKVTTAAVLDLTFSVPSRMSCSMALSLLRQTPTALCGQNTTFATSGCLSGLLDLGKKINKMELTYVALQSGSSMF